MTTDNDSVRAEFEAACKEVIGLNPERCIYSPDSDQYHGPFDSKINAAYWGWQASRELYLPKDCAWTRDEDDFHKTGCGNQFWMPAELGEEYSLKFCAYCGGKIQPATPNGGNGS